MNRRNAPRSASMKTLMTASRRASSGTHRKGSSRAAQSRPATSLPSTRPHVNLNHVEPADPPSHILMPKPEVEG